MEKRKKPFASLATIIIVTAAFSSMLLMQNVTAADPTNWYTKVNGVLKSDYYSLYPFTTKSIDFGLSKFGEMINYPVTAGIGVGLQYPGYDSVGTYDQKAGTSRDPFANEYIDPKLWLNGWLIDIRYTHRTYRDRRVLAMAMFADMAAYGGDWLVGHPYPFNLAPHGGRKTTGYAYTEPLTVLYNGPRRYVALSVTHIYDWFDSDQDGVVDHPNETWPIVDVVLTFIFEKVKKQVIIYKDIKQVITGKELDSPLDIQFSNREEWDLGQPPSYGSYAHFFHQQFETCYGPEWHLAPGIMREWIAEGYNLRQVPVTKDGYSGPIVGGSVRVYVNGTFKEEGTHYNINYATGVITWLIPIDGNDWITVVYKLWKVGTYEEGVPHYYDVAQIISSDLKYVGWKAFWPTLSDYSVDAWDKSLQPLIWVNDTDMVPAASEPDIPFVVGEWDFMLGKGYPAQFRGVEVVGLTDYHDAKDPQMTGSPRAALDIEVKYQLDEVFNPWSLVDAVHKDTERWVQFYNVTTQDVQRANLGYNLIIWLENSPVLYANVWEEYCSFSERVIWGGKLRIPYRSVYTAYDYELYVLDDGTGYIEIPYNKVPPAGTKIKILYSTQTWWTGPTSVNLYSETFTNEALGAEPITLLDEEDIEVITGPDGLGAQWSFYIENLTVTVANETDTAEEGMLDVEIPTGPYINFKVFKNQTAYLIGLNYEHEFSNRTEPTGLWINATIGVIDYDVTAPPLKDLHVFIFKPTVHIIVTATTNGTHCNATVTVTVEDPQIVEGDQLPLYFEYVGGRYEWVTVGRDAHSADSIGASLVSAAFKNKQIEIGNAGFDMIFQEYALTSIPYLLHKFSGTGTGWPPNYKDSIYRIALRDDWCHTWPIASSNVIGVGGPLANHIAEYFNDFTDAFYGLNTVEAPFTLYEPWVSKIIPLSCWNKTGNIYGASADVGYAVISTYKDINGTVGFLVWGISARDTFYASKFFHEEIIYELQNFPRCVTSIIIKIDYTDPEHPTWTIPEVLGTISETTVELVKGGIHPDP